MAADLEKLTREATQFVQDVADMPSDPEQMRSFRHDARNRLNHVFGMIQLVRMGNPPDAIAALFDSLIPILENCLAHLSSSDSSPSAQNSIPFSSADPPLPTDSIHGAKILVADDDHENREILRRLLEPVGYRVSFATDGAETIEQMEQHDFDAVLLDIQMPRMDGFQVLSQLRESGRLGNTPVIVVTGLQEEQDAVRCIEIGAEDFLSRPIRPALLMARLNASLEKKRLREKVFEQHFTPELARELARNPDPMKMQPRQTDVSVLFCDIRGFSAVSERLGAAQTVAWLSGVLGEFSAVVLDHGGVLVDYTGDELLAMWGAPNEQPDHAKLACGAALEILQRLPKLDHEWRKTIGVPTQVGIGINSGEALVGNIGTQLKFKYGPLGTAVNLASRVQGATKYLDTSVLITGATADRARRCYPSRRLCRVRVRNIRTPVDLYQLAPLQAHTEWEKITRIYESALNAFERSDFARAKDDLAILLALAPTDGPARLLLDRIVDYETGSTSSFDPVWSVPGK